MALRDFELFDAAFLVLMVFASPFLFLLTGIILYFYIGFIGIMCALAMILMSFLAIGLSYISKKARGQIYLLTDERIKLLNDFLNGMRIIKLYGWDKSFNQVVKDIRKQEIHKQGIRCISRFIILSLLFSLPGVFVMVIFIININIGGELDLKQSVVVVSIISMGLYFQLGLFGIGVDILQ